MINLEVLGEVITVNKTVWESIITRAKLLENATVEYNGQKINILTIPQTENIGIQSSQFIQIVLDMLYSYPELYYLHFSCITASNFVLHVNASYLKKMVSGFIRMDSDMEQISGTKGVGYIKVWCMKPKQNIYFDKHIYFRLTSSDDNSHMFPLQTSTSKEKIHYYLNSKK